MADQDNISAIMVRLLVSGETSLFIVLGADGSITRKGTGALDDRYSDLYIGVTEPAVFEGLRQQMGQELLGWFGQKLADPRPQGEICELMVGVKDAAGKESWTGFRYGSASPGPPPEVCQFVMAAKRATDPWFERQKTMGADASRHTNMRPWWRF